MIGTITGDAGIGKTSLACLFPKPIVMRVEDGLQAIPTESRPDAFPKINKIDDLWEQMRALIQEEHDYKTVIIDSVTQLEPSFVQYIVDNDPKKPASINQAMGGYGAGRAAVAQLHQRLRAGADLLNTKRDMHVIFIAHADTSTVELPDQDPYTRYDLRLDKRSVSPYIDNVDLVGFLKLETFTTGEGERKKAISSGNRVLTTYTTAANVSKNRYGIKEDLPFELGVNPLIDYIPALRGN